MSKSTRPTWRAAALAALALLVPMLANHDSWRGYFENDDFGTLNWARFTPFRAYVTDLACIRYPCPQERPVGFMLYGALFPAVGLKYPPWAVAMELTGLVNVILLWLVLRELEFGEIEAALGCLAFAGASALFDGWWKPMFIYDVLSTTFALAMLLAYMRKKWVLSFVAFWLAVRTKEIGIVLPAVLLCYEMTLGERKWKRLIPFFLPAAIYGGYGLLFNRHAPHTPYSMSASPAALWRTISFYSSKMFGIPYAGLMLPLALLVTRDRRLMFALGATVFELAMYLLLPERMLEVYLYLAMTGIAIAIATLAAHYRRTVGVLVMIWVAWQFTLVRKQAASTLADGDERRAFADAVRKIPDAPVYLYNDPPESFGHFGGEYVIRVLRKVETVYRLEEDPRLEVPPLPVVTWDRESRRFELSVFDWRVSTFLDKSRQPAAWQGKWPRDNENYRTITNEISIRLYRPASATGFAFEACGKPGFTLHTWFPGEELPNTTFEPAGCITRRYPIKPSAGQVVPVSFTTEGPEQTVRMGSFGFK